MINTLTLCGSARFEQQFRDWDKQLALLTDLCVYNLMVYPSEMADQGGKDWYSRYEKILLDTTYLKKILLSEAILVLDYPQAMVPSQEDIDNNLGKHFNSDGYIGESTAREILFARKLEKKIFFASYYKYDPKVFAEERYQHSDQLAFRNDFDKADKL